MDSAIYLVDLVFQVLVVVTMDTQDTGMVAEDTAGAMVDTADMAEAMVAMEDMVDMAIIVTTIVVEDIMDRIITKTYRLIVYNLVLIHNTNKNVKELCCKLLRYSVLIN